MRISSLFDRGRGNAGRSIAAAGIAAALAATAAVLTGCGQAAQAAGVDGHTYLSVSVDGRELVPGTVIRLQFREGRISANAGCNHLNGPYQWDGHTLAVSDLSTTDMACEPPLMDQDEWLAALLTSRPGLVRDGGNLVLTGTGGVAVTLGDREAVDPDRPLLATRWLVDTIVKGDTASNLPGAPPAWIQFDQTAPGEATKATGNTGCNEFSATAAVAGDSITLSDFAITERACHGDAAAMETAMVTVLQAGPLRYEIEADRLTLTAANADGLGLHAA